MELGADFAALEPELSGEQIQEFQAILSNGDREFLETRSMAVVAEYGSTDAKGNPLTMTIPCLMQVICSLMKEDEQFEEHANESEARTLFNNAVDQD